MYFIHYMDEHLFNVSVNTFRREAMKNKLSHGQAVLVYGITQAAYTLHIFHNPDPRA